MNNPLNGTDPSGYAIDTKQKKIKVTKTGSRLRQTVGSKSTTTVTDDQTGDVTNVTNSVLMDNGNFSVQATNHKDNGSSTTSIGGNTKAGTSASMTFDLGSQESVAKKTATNESDSTVALRSISATDSDGNVYSWSSQQMYPGSPESMFGAMHGAHNSGEGYDAWVAAGGSSSAWDLPLVMMGTSFAGEVIAAIRIAPYLSKTRYGRQVDDFLKSIQEGYAKLAPTDRKIFNSSVVTNACGILIACSNLYFKNPYLPKNPPSFNNGINYLHRWNQNEIPLYLQRAAKVE